MSSPSKLFSCVDSNQILRSPINNSTAKTNWSFSKDDRFKIRKSYCDSFYNIPGLQKNKSRKAGFGYGKKTDLDIGKNPEHIVPPPTTYNLNTFVDTNKLHKKGFTPRNSREEIAPMSYIGIIPKYNTGPGRYEQFRYNQSPKWSMRPRVSSEIFPQTTVKIVPGPVYQNKEQLNKVGRYNLSHHKNSKAKVFNPPHSARFNESGTFVPGSGTYNPNNQLSGQGKYVLSKNVSAGKRKFMLGRRQSFTQFQARRSQTPGPGTYRLPSDFGHYDNIQLMRSSFSKGDFQKTGRTNSSSNDVRR